MKIPFNGDMLTGLPSLTMGKVNIHQEIKDYFLIAVGIFIYSAAVTIFMLPYGLTSGGVSGVSAIIYYATGFEIQFTYVIINACLLIAAIKVLGLKFCLKTIFGVAVMTFFLWLLQRLVEVPDPDHPALGRQTAKRAIMDACKRWRLWEARAK